MANILIPENPMARNVLAGIRALGGEGHSIHIAYPVEKKKNKKLYVEKLLRSRYIKKISYIPHPLIQPDDFISHIISILNENHYDILMPFTSQSFPLISLNSKELKKNTKLICCDFKTYSIANDKEKIASIARNLGISVPNSICPSSLEELKQKASTLEFPVVIKARVHSGMKDGLRYAFNEDELIKGYKEISQQKSIEGVNEFYRPLIQEFIPGKIYDALYYYHKGKLTASFTQCREVTEPLEGGPGVRNISIKDEKLLNTGKILLDSFKWHGPAMVEFKLDPRNNKYILLEVNPKFWGTLDLSIKSGLNFPGIALELALYGKIQQEVNLDFKEGLKYLWVNDFIKSYRAGNVSRRKIIKKLMDKTEFTDLNYKDFKPTLYYLIMSFINLVRNS